MAVFCWHLWGFPRRYREFKGRRAVDVQTCVKCGAQQISRVQFGPARPGASRQSIEVRA
jgi:hypothetical protein